MIEKLKKWLNKNALLSECIFIIFVFIVSSIIQVFICFFDVSTIINCSFFTKLYQTLILENLFNYLVIIDSCTLIVGGLSFFLEKWVEKDTENIVFLMILVVTLFISHVVQILSFKFISFCVSSTVIVLLTIPYISLMKDSINSSKKHNLVRNSPCLTHRRCHMSRQEIKNAESAYAFLCTEVFEGDASKLSIEDLIDCFCARYSHDFLRLPYLDEFDFYDCVLKNANEIIGKKSDGEQKQLAVLLIKKITNYFDIFNLEAVKFFIAAVIVACFNSLKESDQYFRDAFCDFDSDNSNPEAFCRLMIVAAIEDYCRNKCKDIRPWHRSVISFDGDVIKNTICRTEYFSFVKIIWYKWRNPQNLSQHFAILDSFFELDSLPRISIYRTIRMQSVIT